jgi:hypothetical protein
VNRRSGTRKPVAPQHAVASFDSASAMLRVLARHLHGRSSPALGLGPAARFGGPLLLPWVNRLPERARSALYTFSGAAEAVPPRRAGAVDLEAVSSWIGEHDPRRRYPAVLIGSSSGAIAHLAALGGVPWLPQTVLVPVRHLSGAVAETYRAWYTERGVPTDRLLVGSFALLDVHLALQQARVPYWASFGTRPARATLLDHLAETAPYAEIDLGLFSHGTCSAALAGVEEWDEVLRRARRRGDYCGVDRSVYPQDFASNVRFQLELSRRGGTPAPWPWVRECLTHHTGGATSYRPADG